MHKKKVCIVGASGMLGQYMVQQALDRGYEVVGVCRLRQLHPLYFIKTPPLKPAVKAKDFGPLSGLLYIREVTPVRGIPIKMGNPG